jgi:hypothetical protein
MIAAGGSPTAAPTEASRTKVSFQRTFGRSGLDFHANPFISRGMQLAKVKDFQVDFQEPKCK